MENKYTFDDILLAPSFSDAERGDIDISSDFFTEELQVPVLSSPMDTISGKKMLVAMADGGGLGIHHRYCYDYELITIAGFVNGGIAVSPSMGMDVIKELYTVDPRLIVVLDVAHGNTRRNLDYCESLVEMGINVVSGNIANKEAALRYLNIGVKYLRVGIGSGSVCSTRIVTGVGYPQASAIAEINELRYSHPHAGMKIISDGGHKTTGDVVKALALGADFVMLGGMFAGTDEAEGGVNYRGMASAAALSGRKKEFFVEGIGKNVEPKGSVKGVLKNIKDAIEQACYYVGARNLRELREAEIIHLSSGSMRESYVR